MLFRALLQLSRSFATQRQGPAVSKIGIPGVEHIIAVASGKGGVGKSTTAGTQIGYLQVPLRCRPSIFGASVLTCTLCMQ